MPFEGHALFDPDRKDPVFRMRFPNCRNVRIPASGPDRRPATSRLGQHKLNFLGLQPVAKSAVRVMMGMLRDQAGMYGKVFEFKAWPLVLGVNAVAVSSALRPIGDGWASDAGRSNEG